MCAFLLPASGGECQTTHGTARQHYPSASLQGGVLRTMPPGTLSAPLGAPPPPGLWRARPSGLQHGGARCGATWAVLDRRRRMGEGSAAGVPWGDGLGKGGWERRGGVSMLVGSIEKGEQWIHAGAKIICDSSEVEILRRGIMEAAQRLHAVR